MGSVQFAVAVQGASATDADSVTLMVMQSMLGSWDEVRRIPRATTKVRNHWQAAPACGSPSCYAASPHVWAGVRLTAETCHGAGCPSEILLSVRAVSLVARLATTTKAK